MNTKKHRCPYNYPKIAKERSPNRKERIKEGILKHHRKKNNKIIEKIVRFNPLFLSCF